jgi:hypothetical protein
MAAATETRVRIEGFSNIIASVSSRSTPRHVLGSPSISSVNWSSGIAAIGAPGRAAAIVRGQAGTRAVSAD